MFAAQLSHRHAAFAMAQDRKELGFAKSRQLHQNLISHLAAKILRPHPFNFRDDYRWNVSTSPPFLNRPREQRRSIT